MNQISTNYIPLCLRGKQTRRGGHLGPLNMQDVNAGLELTLQWSGVSHDER